MYSVPFLSWHGKEEKFARPCITRQNLQERNGHFIVANSRPWFGLVVSLFWAGERHGGINCEQSKNIDGDLKKMAKLIVRMEGWRI